jgi:DNA polymerase-3 subunit delta
MPAAKTIHLVGGTDEFTVKETAAKLAQQLAPKGAGEFGLEIIEGGATNQDEALKVLARLHEALNTVGFFGAEKLVWLKSTNLLADEKGTTAEATQDGLRELAEVLKRGLPDGVTLLISAIGLDKRRTLYKTLEKTAAIQIFDAADISKDAGREEIAAFTQQKLREAGKQITPDALEVFGELVAPDLREIANEIEKLRLYVGKRTDITGADVRAICSASRQAVVWELTDTLGRRQLPASFAALDNLLGAGESPIGLVILLLNQFRLMLLAKDLERRRVVPSPADKFGFVKTFERLPAEATAHIPRTKEGKLPNAWRLHRCALAAQKFSTAELIRAMELLVEANRQLVSTQLDEKLVLQEAFTKIARKPAR